MRLVFFNQGYVSVCYSACKKGDYIQAMNESGCNYCYYLGLDGKWHYGLSSLGQDITKPESLPKEIKNKFEKIKIVIDKYLKISIIGTVERVDKISTLTKKIKLEGNLLWLHVH